MFRIELHSSQVPCHSSSWDCVPLAVPVRASLRRPAPHWKSQRHPTFGLWQSNRIAAGARKEVEGRSIPVTVYSGRILGTILLVGMADLIARDIPVVVPPGLRPVSIMLRCGAFRMPVALDGRLIGIAAGANHTAR